MSKSSKRRQKALKKKFLLKWETLIDNYAEHITADATGWKNGAGKDLIFSRVHEALADLKKEMADKKYLTEFVKRDIEISTYKILEDHYCRSISDVISWERLYPMSFLGRIPTAYKETK